MFSCLTPKNNHRHDKASSKRIDNVEILFVICGVALHPIALLKAMLVLNIVRKCLCQSAWEFAMSLVFAQAELDRRFKL